MRSWQFRVAIVLSVILLTRLVPSNDAIGVRSVSNQGSFNTNPSVNLIVTARFDEFPGPLPSGTNLTVTINATAAGYVTRTTNFTKQVESGRNYSIGITQGPYWTDACNGYRFMDWNGTIAANPYTLSVSDNTLLIAVYSHLAVPCALSLGPDDIVLLTTTLMAVSIVSRSRIPLRTYARSKGGAPAGI